MIKSEMAQTSNGPVEYTLLGDGPVLLACHGTSCNCFSVDHFSPLLEAGFSVLTPSRPGYGRTPLDAGRTAAQAAGTFVSLLDGLKIRRCSVLAISGGGPTGIALAAAYPDRIERLVLIEAISRPETRLSESMYRSQAAFYGPLHGVTWWMLGLISLLSPLRMARQSMILFSTHDPDDALRQLSPEDIRAISRFYQGASSRNGALTDLAHTVGDDALKAISAPTLVVHSREDQSVPFSHAEWSLANIPHAELCESGCTGHFYWVGPDYLRVSQGIVSFLKQG